MAKVLTKKEEDFSQWYQDLVINADLAEYSPIKGCMIIKPYGYSLWEKIQQTLDKMFKETGHSNAYFPLFIPKSFFEKEAKHVEGFAKECAIVTHYRLKTDEINKKLLIDNDAKLEEELIIRPTSETIIWNTYRNWIKSYRDLPILINQWANVVRWEMRTRLFLRTTEFLWQEGHTAHATREEALEEAIKMLNIYAEFAEKYLAIPVVKGVKTPSERFAGADETFTIEALMQDGKALQAGTSHFLGQNFAKAFDVKFLNKKGELEYVWATSWGVSTRLIGALILTHSDNNGLVLPPAIAPINIVIIPIYKSDDQKTKVLEKCNEIYLELKNLGYSIKFDDRDNYTPGWKFNQYELQGIPIRLAFGPTDLVNNTIEVTRRDTLQKETISLSELLPKIKILLQDIQNNIFNKAKKFKEENTFIVNDFEEFKKKIENGGFFLAHWDGTPETEEILKNETKATIRCIPLETKEEEGFCMISKKKSKKRVLIARAY
ncbi:MAG: proline--tRNA ligase [Bacteroidales bacterium]|nr:proline--tRNA ligase [Bacteroidales bacterium]